MLTNIKENKGQKKIKRENRGAILVPLAVFLIGLIAASALAIDFAMMTSYKRALQNVTEMMAIAAMGYHTDENFDKKVAKLTLNDQHKAKTILGLRNAYFVWKRTKDSLAHADKFLDPFEGIDWGAKYDALATDLLDGDVDDSSNLSLGSYSSSKIRFLQKSGSNYVEPANIDTVADPLLIRAVKNQVNTTSGGFNSILASYFGATAFKVTGSATVEIKNAGKTNSVVILIDRSIAMAGKTGDSSYIPEGDPLYNEKYPGLSNSDLFNLEGLGPEGLNRIVQPMTDILYAARVVPKALGRANWFNDDSGRNSRLGLIAFDLVTEQVGYRDHSPYYSSFKDMDDNTCSGCDNYGNSYKYIYDTITKHAPLKARGGLPELEGLCANSGCRECNTAGCLSTCDASKDEIFYNIAEAKCFATQGLRYAEPPDVGPELDNFFPWSISNEAQGLEVAIELIRQHRQTFYNTYNGPNFDINKEFQGQIVLFSDGLISAFHDRDYVSDPFPQKKSGASTQLCDSFTFNDHNMREFAPVPDPGLGTLVNQAKPMPAMWRKDFNTECPDCLSGDGTSNITWADTVCQTSTGCSEIYHNGSNLYADSLALGATFLPTTASPPPLSTGTMHMMPTDYIVEQGLSGFCPGDQCVWAFVGHEHKSFADTSRKPGIDLYCPDINFMDYVKWAYANGIIIDSIGFGDLGSAYIKSAPTNSMRRQFLLTYAADPEEDGINTGFFLSNVNCGASGTGCPQFESALRRSFTNFEARLR